MSRSYRRGSLVAAYLSKDHIDSRGQRIKVVDMDNRVTFRATLEPLHGQRAEAPGQVDVQVSQMTYGPDVPELDLWCRVYAYGDWYDVAAPPQFHSGSWRTRHWTVELRRRAPERG
jgi:hypothetical protein